MNCIGKETINVTYVTETDRLLGYTVIRNKEEGKFPRDINQTEDTEHIRDDRNVKRYPERKKGGNEYAGSKQRTGK